MDKSPAMANPDTPIHVWALFRHFYPNFSGAAIQGRRILALLTDQGFTVTVLAARDHEAVRGFAAAVETILAISLLVNHRGDADRALRNSSSGLLLQAAELLTGPLPLVLRAFGLVPIAAISFIVGSILSRFGWIWAGRVSGRDPQAVFASQKP